MYIHVLFLSSSCMHSHLRLQLPSTAFLAQQHLVLAVRWHLSCHLTGIVRIIDNALTVVVVLDCGCFRCVLWRANPRNELPAIHDRYHLVCCPQANSRASNGHQLVHGASFKDPTPMVCGAE